MKHSVVLLIAGLATLLAVFAPAAQADASRGTTRTLPGAGALGRSVSVSGLDIGAGTAPNVAAVGVTVALSNMTSASLHTTPADFDVSAEGDIFGQAADPIPAGALSGIIAPHSTRTARLTFMIPNDALPVATLFYHPGDESWVSFILLSQIPSAGHGFASMDSQASSTMNERGIATASSNTIEDNYTRANQTGWGTTSNNDGVTNVAWGLKGNGSRPEFVINNNNGVVNWASGDLKKGLYASAGSSLHNGGDALAEVKVSASGHVSVMIALQYSSSGQNYYAVRIDTSRNKLFITKRQGSIIRETSVHFVASVNTWYWLRMNADPGSKVIKGKVWQDGTSEPGSWTLTWTDSGTWLAQNLVVAGATWNVTPSSAESVRYGCYAYSASPSVSAQKCGSGTSGTITQIPLTGGKGDPWGTAIDSSGNVWFAEPGCDFAPTCSSSTPPGQIGKLPAGSTTPVFFTLPNITGNQPIFVALDSSGNVWFTTPNNSMIGEFNPATGHFVGQWAVTPGSGPWDLGFNNGELWYTEHLVSSIGKFDPSTHTFQDFATPTANSNPYGIAANDPINSHLIWFTENKGSVARIGVLDTTTNAISEYLIRASLPGSSLTPHLLALDANGNPWWTEGFIRAIGNLNVPQATPGQCGVSSGDCIGITEYSLPTSNSGCSGSHVSGIAMQGGGSLIWLDDSLSTQMGSFNPSTSSFTLHNLTCGVHPHDGLNFAAGNSAVWWDEEFANALGELS